MAWVQSRSGSWRILFRYNKEQHTFLLGQVEEHEARAVAAKVDYWLMRLKQKLVQLPPGCDIVTFVQHDGNPPTHPAPQREEINLSQLRDRYLESQKKKLEQTTLDGISLHFKHLIRILGAKRLISPLTRADLQAYVDKRSSEWIDPNIYRKKRREKQKTSKGERGMGKTKSKLPDKPLRHPSAATIKKEMVSLRTAWNWSRRYLLLAEEFPGSDLDYAKTQESLPFMTWEEAIHRIETKDDPEKVWECVYLRPEEITELLAWVQERPVSPWVYPMFCFAAHTGARRSEIVRVLYSDLDLANEIVTIREKKRDSRKHTTRRVPLSSLLKEVLTEWIKNRGDGATLFCKENGKEILPREAHNYFQRALRLSKWSVLKGWHVFRHSFISALASRGVDQRVIDDLVGHCTEEQRRRYRHLYPDVKKQAVAGIFQTFEK